MLLEIAIRNIALIDELRLELGEGLNVLTGETGAGKSIVVGALTLVLGGRADKSMIRTGADRAQVEALFDISLCPEAQQLLDEWGLRGDDDMASVRRELNSAGRSVCRVNGSVMPLNQFRRFTAALVELHGQHEHQLLCDPAQHTAFLDAFGGEAHQALLESVRADYETWQERNGECKRLKGDLAERERIRDMLSFQLQEINAVKPKAGEMEALEKKSQLLHSAGKISERLNRACDLIYRGGKGPSAQEALKKAADSMSALEGLHDRFDAIRDKLYELFYAAQDVGYELQDLCEGMEFDPDEEEKVASRLSALKTLTRKYGPELEDVLAFRDNITARLEEIENGDERLAAAERDAARAQERLAGHCEALHQSREALAQSLSKRIMEEMKALGMEKARFEVRFDGLTEGRYSALGAEKAQFMLSANPGEPVKPLSDVASGGELSRIMLAMKTAAADQAGVDAMVFDEIDTGVSGRMAQAVGEKMAVIALKRQVICVSHLPQIAALGDRQYLVEKKEEGGRTATTVRLLDHAGRVGELARMVGGAGDLESSRIHAANLLEAARARVEAMKAQRHIS